MGSYESSVDTKAPERQIAPQHLAAAALDALERDDWIGHIVGVTNAT